MIIGVPKEVKIHEYRVGLLPASVRELTAAGHKVVVEKCAGQGVGAADDDYLDVGAELVPGAEDVYAAADLIVKVKEPQPGECELLRRDQVLFTYLHLAAEPDLAGALCRIGVTAIAYETVTAADGSLPLLTPMSEVAGRMSIQVGATCLQRPNGGAGILLAGVPGVAPAKVVILGGGVAGTNAAQMAVGLGADVTIVDRSLSRLRTLDVEFAGRARTQYSTGDAIEALMLSADLAIGAVLLPGAATPRLVSRQLVSRMQNGSVLVDISVDQGGCFETSRPTTHSEPTYVVDGVVHYCVTNMPGAVPRTSAQALNNATLPFVLELANLGCDAALRANGHLAAGLNVRNGKITHPAVAEAIRVT